MKIRDELLFRLDDIAEYILEESGTECSEQMPEDLKTIYEAVLDLYKTILQNT